MLTPLDHWLRDKFLFQTHVYTKNLPDKLPWSVRTRKLEESYSNTYRYRLISNSSKLTNKLINRLDQQGLMYSTHVVERKTLLKPIVAPKCGSVVLLAIWLLTLAGLGFGVFKLARKLGDDEVFMANLRETIDIFREVDRR